MQKAITEPEQFREPAVGHHGAVHLWSRLVRSRYAVPVIYLIVALPLEVFLCFFTPPMQPPDESRHFLRASQFAQGQLFPQINPATHLSGGILPAALVDFVHEKVNPEYYRSEDRLHTIGARLRALSAAAQHQAPPTEKKFGVFFDTAIYAPSLYLPQAVGIRLARFFTDKVYVWFYTARVLNAAVAVLLIFLALLLAPGYRLALLIPAILPMSFYEIASASSGAGFISIGILLVALCLRFVHADSRLLRAGIILCLLLLDLEKPVYLPLALLVLPAYKRLGWRRVILFCAGAIGVSALAYLAWATCVRPVMGMAGNDFPGHDPAAQVHFILAHPIGFIIVLLRSIRLDAPRTIGGLIGFFGWSGMPLPPWFYTVACLFLAAVALLFLLNWKNAGRFHFLWGAVTAIAITAAVFVAAYVMWTPVAYSHALSVQGRYLLPALAALAFCVPPLYLLKTRSRITLVVLVFAFFALSVFTTVHVLKHYYFPESGFVGKNVRALFTNIPNATCPATLRSSYTPDYFSMIVNGSADTGRPFRVVVADQSGKIWGESDPALSGREFPFDLLQGSTHRHWRMNLWRLNRSVTLDYWLIRGNSACTFGSPLKLEPYTIPSS